jgi:hypothetical protein
MKLIVTVALLLGPGLALADKYSPGATCRNNFECDANCLDGLYTIADQNGKYAFVCDPDPPAFYAGQCQNTLAAVGDLSPHFYNERATTSACLQLRGKLCRNGCVVTGDMKTPDLTFASWRQACAAAGANDNELSKRGREGAEVFTECR